VSRFIDGEKDKMEIFGVGELHQLWGLEDHFETQGLTVD
jgi:hypothetical protein